MTALCYACHEGRMEAIRLLMDRAADPNLADLHGVTPLQLDRNWPARDLGKWDG